MVKGDFCGEGDGALLEMKGLLLSEESRRHLAVGPNLLHNQGTTVEKKSNKFDFAFEETYGEIFPF